ncbi:MAG: hypothetical protein QM831_40475 [Kofleriaceae bacterium]
MYDPDVAHLKASLRQTRRLAIGAGMFAILAGAGAVFALLHKPDRIEIGDVTISDNGILIKNSVRGTEINAGAIFTREGNRGSSLAPAELDLIVKDGARVSMWAADHAGKLSLTDRNSDTGWMLSTGPDQVSVFSRPAVVEQH